MFPCTCKCGAVRCIVICVVFQSRRDLTSVPMDCGPWTGRYEGKNVGHPYVGCDEQLRDEGITIDVSVTLPKHGVVRGLCTTCAQKCVVHLIYIMSCISVFFDYWSLKN